jgi:hypothetical protein
MNSSLPHLTDDQLDEVLLGFASEEASEHAIACIACRERVAAFELQMLAFNRASSAWAEARSNSISRELNPRGSFARISPTALWSAAAAAAFAAIFGATVLQSQPRTPAHPSAAVAVVHNPHPASELASDDEMLNAIDSEFGTPQPARFGLYQDTTSDALRRRQTRQVKD